MTDSFVSLSSDGSIFNLTIPVKPAFKRRFARLVAAPMYLYSGILHRCDVGTGLYEEW